MQEKFKTHIAINLFSLHLFPSQGMRWPVGSFTPASWFRIISKSSARERRERGNPKGRTRRLLCRFVHVMWLLHRILTTLLKMHFFVDKGPTCMNVYNIFTTWHRICLCPHRGLDYSKLNHPFRLHSSQLRSNFIYIAHLKHLRLTKVCHRV